LFYDIFLRLQPLLANLLLHRDEDSQLLVLKILSALLPSLSFANISTFLDHLLQTFPQHSSEVMRLAYYQIIIWLYENCEELKGSDLLRGYLLRGLFLFTSPDR